MALDPAPSARRLDFVHIPLHALPTADIESCWILNETQKATLKRVLVEYTENPELQQKLLCCLIATG